MRLDYVTSLMMEKLPYTILYSLLSYLTQTFASMYCEKLCTSSIPPPLFPPPPLVLTLILTILSPPRSCPPRP